MAESAEDCVASRAAAYNQHYRRTGWRVERFTEESIAALLHYALDREEGGNLNGNEIEFALRRTGFPNVAGLTFLDYCCGTGITAIYFALHGARVEAFDRSEAAIDIARRSAQLSGVDDRVTFVVADGRELPYETATFDCAFCQSALHIVVDYPECAGELARVIKPGAKAMFCEEGLAYNPILRPIRYIRRRAWRNCGGHPLKYADIYNFGRPFSDVLIRHFGLLAQVKTAFRGELRRHGRLRTWSRRLLRTLEHVDCRILSVAPWMRRYCGAVVVEYVK